MGAGEARAALNEMALRQNDWALGAFCARYCTAVNGHHRLEDAQIFPHLRRSEPDLDPVIDRLEEEHRAIHDALQGVNGALVHHLTRPNDFSRIGPALDLLTDALLSHLSYEEWELVGPRPSRLLRGADPHALTTRRRLGRRNAGQRRARRARS